ncbi:hypothetical protein MKEN_00864700 [Mycena kentingensis (nom. inval.)]|nr:hypothetical protein MKEN_00864700 [Mycena kentingensis (nom. inval.)]
MTTNYSNPTLAETALSATVVEAVLYGASHIAGTRQKLDDFRGRHWRDVHYAMLAAASVLFISSTAHIGISAGRLGIFLFEIGDDYPGGPTAWFYDPSHQTFATKNILLLLETLVADAVVIYRCYIVWQAIWVVVLPIVLWIGIAVSGSANIYHARYLHTNQDPQRRVYIAWFMACSLSCNIIAIGFLAYRLWRAHADASSIRSGKDVIFPVLRIVLDAGALYSSALICSIIVYLLRFPAQFIAVDITPSVIAIAFYMVFLRVGLARPGVAISRQFDCAVFDGL